MKKTVLFCFLLESFLTVTVNISAQDMVLIPAGEFIMGKNTAQPSDWQPEHPVKIDSLYMDSHEVSNSEYFEFCQATGYRLPQFWGMAAFSCGPDYPDHPVVGVSFFDAMKFAEWKGKRLPTEAEWEYAARGGLERNSYPWGEGIDSSLVNYGRKYGGTLKTGSFPPNAYGLYDMGGSVWEWTMDVYSDTYYAESPANNPTGPVRGRFKVIRGGSWHSGAMCIQTYYRNGLSPSWLDFAVGFRCVKDL